MLGTGCAVPSKHRAPAAIYLHAFSRGGVLLDAGEGSLGQLHALFGPEGARGALRGLSAIFISHHHADHHLGLMRLLEVLHLIASDDI
jgi:ribonuclease Z